MFLHSYAHARFLREFCTSLHQLLASAPSLTDINLLGNAFPRRKWRVANEGWREWRRISAESLMPSRQPHGSSRTDAEDQMVSGDPSSSPCGKCWFVWFLGIKRLRQEEQAERSSKSVASLLSSWQRDFLKDWRLSFMSESCCSIIVWVPGVNRYANSVTTTRTFIRVW